MPLPPGVFFWSGLSVVSIHPGRYFHCSSWLIFFHETMEKITVRYYFKFTIKLSSILFTCMTCNQYLCINNYKYNVCLNHTDTTTRALIERDVHFLTFGSDLESDKRHTIYRYGYMYKVSFESSVIRKSRPGQGNIGI